MSKFLQIINEIQQPLLEIGQKNLEEKAVSLEVAQLLSTISVQSEFDQNDLLNELLSTDIKSYYSAGSFSDFHCLIAENEFFRTELYFWDRRDTGIHSHPFLGAFQCLKGSLMVLDYDFIVTESIHGSREVNLGNLTLRKKQKILKGDIYPIEQGANHIHKTIHLEPTVNLCIRSRTAPTLPNYSFVYPALRIEKKTLSSQEERWLELYGYLSLREENEALQNATFEKFDLPSLINFIVYGKRILPSLMNEQAVETFYSKCLSKINQIPKWDNLPSILIENERFIQKINLAYRT